MCLNIDTWLTVYNHTMMWLSARGGVPLLHVEEPGNPCMEIHAGIQLQQLLNVSRQSTVGHVFWRSSAPEYAFMVTSHLVTDSCVTIYNSTCSEVNVPCDWNPLSKKNRNSKNLSFLKSTIGFARSKFLRRCESKPAVPTIPEWSPTSVLSRPMTA